MRLVKDIELSNLARNRRDFKEAFENIRLKHNAGRSNGQNIQQSLKTIDSSFKKIIRNIFKYLHGMLGGPPIGSRHATVCVGSLATQMTTPYSDIEYIILIDKQSDTNRVYFTNFADLFELLMISLGESPIYTAEEFLKEFKPYFKYIKNGARVDEHKRPQDINRLYGLINTPEELLPKVATRKIHESGNHTTSALLTTGFLEGDEKLYAEFAELFKKLLPTEEYLECLRKLLEEDIRASIGLQKSIENSFYRKEDKDIEVKSILIQPLHLARQLAIFLISTGEGIELKTNFFDVLEELKNGKYIGQEQYQRWQDLVAKLFVLRLELQIKPENQSSKARIKLKDLHQKINIPTLVKQLQEITNIVESSLDERKSITNSRKIADIIERTDSFGKQFQRPPVNPHFVPRGALQTKINEHFKDKEQQILTLAAHGMGGMGKTTLASHYFQHPAHHYTIRAWFNAGSREQIYQQYLSLIKDVEDIEYPKDMPIEEQVKRTKHWLEKQQDCLLVFDNVEKAEDLEGLLPEQGKHHILITSRSEIGWPKKQRLDIDKMEVEEAIDLIVKITGIDKEKNKTHLQELVGDNYLGCLPLAVAQAGAYMDANSVNIQKYMDRFKQSKEKFLSEENFNIKHLPVWVTFNMDFDALQKTCPMALNTLKQASWLNHAAIPEIFLSSMINTTDETKRFDMWDDIKKQLKRYSLMRFDIENSLVGIHPLLREVLLSKQTQGEQIKTFRYVCNRLYPMLNPTEKTSFYFQYILPHVNSLNKYEEDILKLAINKYNINFDFKYKYIENTIILAEKTINEKTLPPEKYINMIPHFTNRGYILLRLNNPNAALKCYKWVLNTQKKYKIENTNTFLVLLRLADIFLRLNEQEMAKEYYYNALKIQSMDKRPNINMYSTLLRLGNCFLKLGEFEIIWGYYYKVKEIDIKYFNGDSISEDEYDEILLELGNLFLCFDYLDEAAKYCEQEKQNILSKDDSKRKSIIYTSLAHIFYIISDLNRIKIKLEEILKIPTYTMGPFVTIPYDNMMVCENCFERALKYKKHLSRLWHLIDELEKTYLLEGPQESKLFDGAFGIHSSFKENLLNNLQQINNLEKSWEHANHERRKRVFNLLLKYVQIIMRDIFIIICYKLFGYPARNNKTFVELNAPYLSTNFLYEINSSGKEPQCDKNENSDFYLIMLWFYIIPIIVFFDFISPIIQICLKIIKTINNTKTSFKIEDEVSTTIDHAIKPYRILESFSIIFDDINFNLPKEHSHQLIRNVKMSEAEVEVETFLTSNEFDEDFDSHLFVKHSASTNSPPSARPSKESLRQLTPKVKNFNLYALSNLKEENELLLYNKDFILKPKKIVRRDELYYEGIVTSDGSCLFYSVAIAFLFKVAHDEELFKTRFINLFGEEVADAAEENRQYLIRNGGCEVIENPEILLILVNHNFRKRVVAFMRRHKEKFSSFIPENEDFETRMQGMEHPYIKAWGDQPEIAGISEMLKVNISIYQRKEESQELVSVAQHNIGGDTEICLLYTQATTNMGVSNPNNHYNYLLQKQNLSFGQDKSQNVAANEPKSIRDVDKVSTEIPIMLAPTDFAAMLEMQSNFLTTCYSFDVETTEKNNIEQPLQSWSPSVSSGYISNSLPTSFAHAAQNIGNAARQIAIPLLFSAHHVTEITRGFSQLVTNFSRAGIVNGLQQLARPRCSLDGTGPSRSFLNHWFR